MKPTAEINTSQTISAGLKCMQTSGEKKKKFVVYISLWSEVDDSKIMISHSGCSCLVYLRKHSEISVNTKKDLRDILKLYYYQHLNEDRQLIKDLSYIILSNYTNLLRKKNTTRPVW